MASALSPQIRILAGGEHRVLTDIGRVDPSSLASYREHGTPRPGEDLVLLDTTK